MQPGAPITLKSIPPTATVEKPINNAATVSNRSASEQPLGKFARALSPYAKSILVVRVPDEMDLTDWANSTGGNCEKSTA